MHIDTTESLSLISHSTSASDADDLLNVSVRDIVSLIFVNECLFCVFLLHVYVNFVFLNFRCKLIVTRLLNRLKIN